MKKRYSVTEQFKIECKENATKYEKTGKIHVIEDNIDITESDNLVDFSIKDNCYVKDNFIGTTVAKKITVNILNPNNEINLEDKEITAQTGMIINGKEEIVPFGNFIIEKPDSKEAKEKTSFTGYDYMVKFNILYKNRVTFPISAGDLFKDVCGQAGVEVGNTDFINSGYMILGNPFTNNENCRTVLSNIAQLAGGFAKIGRDNKAYIKSLKNISNLLKVKDVNAMTVKELNLTIVKMLSGGKDNADETLDGNNYLDDFSKNNKWGKVNSLVIRISGIEGENTSIPDEASINEEGLTEVVIEDNYFLIDEAERKKVITALWNALKEIEYLPFKTTYYGYPYIDSGDIIYIQDTKDIGYISYVFNHTFTFNGGFSGEIETPALTKTQVAYKSTTNAKTKFKQTERKIDKINGIIEDIIEEQNETSQKLSQHEQTIDSIKDTVSSVETKIEIVENKTIYRVDVMYALSDSSTQIPTTGWSTTAPAWENGKYMWQKTVTTYGDGSTEETSATCITGAKGEDGQDGTDGKNGTDGQKGDTGIGIKEIVEQYYLSTSDTTQTGGSWKTTQDAWSKGKYIWTRNKITWTDDTITYTTPILATGLNNANSMANNANTTANNANTTANEAKNTANSAITQVQTTTEKLAEVEQTVDGITQTVSSVETKIETVEGKAEQAQSSADTANKNAQAAQQTADNINNNLTTNYYTKTETNSQIQQTADSITSTVTKNISTAKQEAIDSANASIDEKLLGYATTTEMNSSIEQKADEINTRINKIQDITNTISGTKTITLENCVPGALLELHVYGNNQVFKHLYPENNLYPSDDLYPYGDSRIILSGFNEESEESTSVDIYELGVTDVLRQNSTTRDEYVLKDGKAQVIRRINQDGTVKTTEEIEDLGEYYIELKDVENIIQIKNYSAEIEAKYAIKNDYTDIYATKVEMNSSIKQTAEEINLEVSKKVGEDEVISKINQSAEAVGINANKIELSANDVLNLLAGNTINLSSKNIKISSNKFKVDEDGNITCSNGVFLGGNIQLIRNRGMDYFQFYDTENKDNQHRLYLDSRTLGINSGDYNITMAVPPVAVGFVSIALEGNGSRTEIRNTGIKTPTLTQTSLAEEKKNFEKMSDNALNIIKSIDIYKYNLKNEKETDKKHIGFVIGDDYNYSKEVTSIDNTGVDNYSFTSLCCKAIQEQQKQIEQLTNELKELKEEK